MDLSNSLAIWRNVLTKPSEATFAAEKERPNATLITALIWVVAASLINFIAQAITFLLFDPVQQFIDIYTELLVASGTSQTMIDEILSQMGGDGFKNTLLLGLFLGVILSPIIFLLGSGILWGVARVFGGNGDYSKQTYLISTYYAPLMIINVLASFIPFLGLLIAVGVMVYQVVLTYFAMRVAHQLTPGKAMGAIVTPFIGLFFVSCCCSFALVSSLATLQ
jgi:hypothetical protein